MIEGLGDEGSQAMPQTELSDAAATLVTEMPGQLRRLASLGMSAESSPTPAGERSLLYPGYVSREQYFDGLPKPD